MKYKNKDGIELSMTGKDSHQVLVREVISEAIKILSSYNHFDDKSKDWAIQRCKDFLQENFNLRRKND
jgi:hypothetical protein|tara:strand:- start:94 stop:297 length:204 start_codon:yes stop_codon:yes gene_type:complete